MSELHCKEPLGTAATLSSPYFGVLATLVDGWQHERVIFCSSRYLGGSNSNDGRLVYLLLVWAGAVVAVGVFTPHVAVSAQQCCYI